MKNQEISKKLLDFFVSAEKLKTIMRHAYTSNTSRQESTAEHTWMLCLIAITIFEHITLKFDQLKVLKMLILHDFAEAIIGDIPAFDKNGRIGKYEKEKNAFEKLINSLPTTTQKEFLSVWEEYEKKETNEAKIAQAIDKFESPLQHNIFGVEHWDQNDFDIHGFYKFDTVAIEPFLLSLREELETMSRKTITEAKQLHRLPSTIQKKYNERNKTNE